MKVLVTGANGFVGRHLVPRLAEAGYQVRSLVRAHGAAHGTEVVVGSLPDPALCRLLCQDVQAVIHTAGVAHVNTGRQTLREQNFDATLQLAAAAREQGVRKFIFLSSSKARYPAHSAYARVKAETEAALRQMHAPGTFEVVCVRPALVYGKGMRGNLRSLLRVLARRRLPVFPSSTNPLGMISVEDLCRALVAALDAGTLPDRAWDIADGTRYTLDSLVTDVRRCLHYGAPALALPRWLFHALAVVADFAAPVVRTPLSLSTYRTLFDESYEPEPGFSQHTGFTPQDSFRARLPELLEDLKS